MEQLHALAQACGVARDWVDVAGRRQEVSDPSLAAVLAALGHDAGSERQIACSIAAMAERRAESLRYNSVARPIQRAFSVARQRPLCSHGEHYVFNSDNDSSS